MQVASSIQVVNSYTESITAAMWLLVGLSSVALYPKAYLLPVEVFLARIKRVSGDHHSL